MSFNKKLAVAVCFLSLMSGAVLAIDDNSQRILDLRKQIEELTKQADQYKNNVAAKQKEADTLARQIDILNNQISRLQTQITLTSKQIDSTGLEINELQGQIFDTQNQIGKQKSVIGDLISSIYQKDRSNLVSILIKNPRLSDFADEAQQEQDLSSKLTSLLSNLKNEKNRLQSQKDDLDSKKSELETLNKKQAGQKISLSGNKEEKDKVLVKTKGQEAQYQKLLTDTEQKKAEFFNELQSLETKALQNGSFIVHVTSNSIPPKGSKIFTSPYDDYVLTQGYGYTSYAKRGAYGGAPHNGIDLASGFGSPIKPIGNGLILASGTNNGWGNWVAVRHDNNLVSLYGHMKAAEVLPNGTPVTIDSIIGYEGSTGNATGSHLHLSIYWDFFTFINDKTGQLNFNYFEGTLNPFDYLQL